MGGRQAFRKRDGLLQHCCVVNRDKLTRHGWDSWSKVDGQQASLYFTTAWYRPEAALSDRLLAEILAVQFRCQTRF